jgi:hypothetical protein
MVRRRERELRALFRSVLLMSIAGGAWAGVQACSSSSSTNGGPGGDGSDASTGGSDASSTHDSAGSTDSSTQSDGGVGDGGHEGGTSACDPTPIDIYAGGAPNDAGFYCEYGRTYPCGLPSFVTNLYPPTCNFGLSDCSQICTGAAANFKDCHVAVGKGCDDAGNFVAPDGAPIDVICGLCGGVGRRPSGLARARLARGRTPLGDYFAQVAHLEAASVPAFTRLRDELLAHGAPKSLVKMAERCARDEVRHARVTERIAKRHGGSPKKPRVQKRAVRSLETIAIENAVEGCVRETFGAMVATWQAANARDREIAEAMETIAVDETRHAALAWEVARWAEAKLGLRARAKLASKKRAAVEELAKDTTRALDASIVREAGVPSPAQAERLLGALRAQLWA